MKEYDHYRSFDTKYRVILEQCGSAFIIVDETGNIVDFNKKATTIIEKTDLQHLTLEDLINQGTSIEILNELETLNKNAPSNALKANLKGSNKKVQLKGTFFRSNEGVHTLIRLNNLASQKENARKNSIYLICIKNHDAFVFIDEAGKIVDTNDGF